ncbi:MAG: hypothetical protein KKH75_04175, partial [Actinobacteria bacterium]|nr:hypothetical protein [Actinomycetota bacterium]
MMLNRRHRVALLDASGRRVRVVHGASRPELPRLDVSWPEPSDLFAAVGVDEADTLSPPWRDDDGIVTHVMRIPDGGSAGGAWCPLDEVVELSTDAVERITADVVRWSETHHDDDRPAWYRAGWREGVDAWVDGALAARGLVRRGAAELIKLWSLSAVLRYTVDDDASGQRSVWFKATYDGFHAEPAITEEVAAHAPELAP